MNDPIRVARRGFLAMLSHVPLLAWMFGKPSKREDLLPAYNAVLDDTLRAEHYSLDNWRDPDPQSRSENCFAGQWIPVTERLPECDIGGWGDSHRMSREVLIRFYHGQSNSEINWPGNHYSNSTRIGVGFISGSTNCEHDSNGKEILTSKEWVLGYNDGFNIKALNSIEQVTHWAERPESPLDPIQKAIGDQFRDYMDKTELEFDPKAPLLWQHVSTTKIK